MNRIGDFHIHSTYSDGRFSVKELICRYEAFGYQVISITDHDTMDGCEEAIQYGKTKGIRAIAGIEISTKYNGEDIHILGYFKDEDCCRKEMMAFGAAKKEARMSRCKKMTEVLKDHFNIEINAKKLLEEHKDGMIGRPHIAKAIIEAGYGENLNEVFEKYLSDDSPAYIPSSFLTPQEGIDLLRNNHAVVVLAHPVLLKRNRVLDVLETFHFDGMEALYSSNTEEDTIRLKEICKERGLLITGGSDFHDFYEDSNARIGVVSLDESNIEKLLNRL